MRISARFSITGKNVALLAICQGLLFSINTVFAIVSGLVGLSLAPDPVMATVPLGLFIFGAALATFPASLFMARKGRRVGFLVGASFGFYGGLIAAFSIAIQSFSLLSIAGLMMGVFFAFGQYYRFAIADVCEGSLRRYAISIVLAGGLISGVIGPNSAAWSRDLLSPYTFMACYLVISAFCCIKLWILTLIEIPIPSGLKNSGLARPLNQIIRQPRFIVAALAGMVSWAAMNQLMMGTPLAMHMCSLPFSDSAFVMQWHQYGMFAPGFFVGALINKFGIYKVLMSGTVILLGAVSAVVSGVGLWNFWWATFLVGVGWCFLFVGSTVLVTECCTIDEQAKTQGFNDFLVFLAAGCGTFMSGALLNLIGWDWVGYSLIPLIIACGLSVFWLFLREKPSVIDSLSAPGQNQKVRQ